MAGGTAANLEFSTAQIKIRLKNSGLLRGKAIFLNYPPTQVYETHTLLAGRSRCCIGAPFSPGYLSGWQPAFGYFFRPISRNLSSRYSPAVASGYAFGCALSTQLSRHARLILLLGCRKKGMEYRDVPHFSRGGLTTRCVVDFNLLLVSRCSISPTLTTICSGREVTGTH